jgi:predicted AlkP superfamily pyrophosphatase or phosphodiesterase
VYRDFLRGRATAVLVASALLGAGATDAAASPRRSFQVVIISIDGLRPDALSEAATPNIMRLARRGSYTLRAETVTPSETTPGHASMLSGYTPKVHKITWDEWKPEKGNITVPTLLSTAKACAFQTVMVVGKNKLQHVAPQGGIFVFAPRGDDDVINEAVVRALLPFDILFVHLPNVDLVGHSKGWMSSEYMTQLSYTDQSLGRLLSAIPANATIILSADHGGSAFDHGTERSQNMTIPWMISGPGIAVGKALTTHVKTMDTAVTAASILGLFMPADTQGKTITEAILADGPTMPDIIHDPTDY